MSLGLVPDLSLSSKPASAAPAPPSTAGSPIGLLLILTKAS